MQEGEIERYLAVGREHSIEVDVRYVEGVPGVLRTVTIHRDTGSSSGSIVPSPNLGGRRRRGVGPKYIGRSASLPEVIEPLERYLGCRAASWTNYTSTPFVAEQVDESVRW